MSEQIKVTYIRSAISRPWTQQRVIKALGFKKLHQTRIMQDIPAIRGMINKVIHLVTVEPVGQSQE